MIGWTVTAVAAVCLAMAALAAAGRSREKARTAQLRDRLLRVALQSPSRRVRHGALGTLPDPVVRYFCYALADGQPIVRAARFRQRGTLRTGIESDRWLEFTAEHLIVPPAVAFVWDARVRLSAGIHLRVLDSYGDDGGRGRVSLLSALPLAAAAGEPELGAAALQRYLAEAVWCPTALLPEAGVVWSAVDDRSALATLRDRNHTVSVEFRFDEAGEITSVYSPSRYRLVHGQFHPTPWEGRFSHYEKRFGMSVPTYGEVGWHDRDDRLHLVWKGRIVDADYDAV